MRHMLTLAAAVSILLCCYCSAYCGISGYEKPDIVEEQVKLGEKYIEKGIYHFEKKAYRKALAEFESAVEVSPQFFNARYNIARTYLAMGQPKVAAGKLESINTDFEGNIAGYTMLGQIYAGRGEKEKAIEAFETAVANGEALLEEVDIPQAKVDIAMAYHNLGSMQVDSGDLEAGEENLRKSVEANDSNYFSHYALGELLVRVGKITEAKDELHKARELNFAFVETDIELAKANLLSNPPNIMRAISILRDAIRKDPEKAEIYELLGNCYVVRKKTSEEAKRNDYAEAMKYYRDAINLDKDNPKYKVLLARACALAGEYDTATKILEKLEKSRPELPDKIRKEIYLVEAHILRDKEQWSEAGVRYAKVFEIDPRDYAACFEAGKCYFEAEDFQEAEKYLEMALEPFEENSEEDTPKDVKQKLDEARKMLLEIREAR